MVASNIITVFCSIFCHYFLIMKTGEHGARSVIPPQKRGVRRTEHLFMNQHATYKKTVRKNILTKGYSENEDSRVILTLNLSHVKKKRKTRALLYGTIILCFFPPALCITITPFFDTISNDPFDPIIIAICLRNYFPRGLL